jgi:uncharacterized cysteine cluster protein YcgN (CxxCxxCC family)
MKLNVVTHLSIVLWLSSKCDYFCAATGKDRPWERTLLSGKKIMQKNLTIMGSWEVMQHGTQ